MQITLDEIAAHQADVFLPPDADFAEDYAEKVRLGREVAKYSTVAFVAICRNAMPFLPMTLNLVEQAGAMFRDWSAYIYENDSTDATQDVLGTWADGQQRQASLNINGRPHLNGTTEPVRTHALAEYRSKCQLWVQQGEPVDLVVVFDTDPWGGFSVDGIANSIAWLHADPSWYGLASYSWAQHGDFPIHYDAFAARLGHYRRRDQLWFHHWHPAIGSPPVEFCSAFGQLCVYRAQPFLRGVYRGHDCEHVTLHQNIAEATGMRLGLNPASRCVSFWNPSHGRQHSHD